MNVPARISGRDFNKRASALKREVQEGGGPIVITDHGTPVAVLVSWEDYSRNQTGRDPLTELLAAPDTADIELPIERDRTPHRAVDL